MDWNEIKTRSDEIIRHPADFDRQNISKLIDEINLHVLNHMDESAEASQLETTLRNLLSGGSETTYPDRKELETDKNNVSTLVEADDLYYAAEYEKAIAMYEHVLEQEPTNLRAKEQIQKARLLYQTSTYQARLPREAVQYYRRARSFLNAKDIIGAKNLLDKAIEIAEFNNVSFPEAIALLDGLRDAILSSELVEQSHLAIENLELTNAYNLIQKAINLDSSNSVLNVLITEIYLIINVQQEITFLENANTCDSSLYNEILDKLYAIKHPWLLDTKIVEKIQSDLSELRKQKSDHFEEQGVIQLEHAKEALYLSVISELSGRAIENFERALKCDSQKINLPSLISEAKTIKDKVGNYSAMLQDKSRNIRMFFKSGI